MKRTSKYVGKQFGNWICTEIGIASVQGKRAKWAGHCSYWYSFERLTRDSKCEKIIRLNAAEAAKVYHGIMTVEELLNKREATPKQQTKVNRKISYRFI